MKEALAAYDVTVVALSKDTAAQAAVHRNRDQLSMLLLADPNLEVIRTYGVEHHKALGFKTGAHAIFGLPLVLFPSIVTMAIPTSLLIDEHGVIRWIDQSDDYRLRSNPDTVLGAVQAAFS